MDQEAPTLGLEVSTESPVFCEAASTMHAAIGFLTRVCAHVSLQGATLTEHLRTDGAHVGHGVRVGTHVHLARILKDDKARTSLSR